MPDNFVDALSVAADLTAEALAQAMRGLGDLRVAEAMRYAVRGGKGLRGFLVLESARLHGVGVEQAIWPAAAIEAMHAYSLVHDDLPCMDDDDLRRGQPTVHRKWDEATAVLAGDALQALAFELLSRTETSPSGIRIALVASLARAAGVGGMVRGQALDIAAETADPPLTLEAITSLQAAKTGALFGWAAQAGAVMAGADPARLRRYAAAMGLAYQIADDILDVAGDDAKTGKALRKDAAAGKATFVSLLGLDGARQRAAALAEEACGALASYGDRAETLRQAARFAIARES
jgi:farnesyl diphosphate synthase